MWLRLSKNSEWNLAQDLILIMPPYNVIQSQFLVSAMWRQGLTV